jgi:hypothetical protein
MIKREEKWTISLQLVDAQVLKKRKKANYVLIIKYILIANYCMAGLSQQQSVLLATLLVYS